MTQITEDYVSFETAKLLKEKGFDEECKIAYFNKTLVDYTMFGFCLGGDLLYCPTLQMAMKWLREIHKLCITITPKVTDSEGSGGCLWEWAITCLLIPQSVSLELFESYEQTCEAAIKYCLENLI